MVVPALLLAVLDTGAVLHGACGADSMYRRVPVYTRVTVGRPADTTAATSVLLIAEAVATRVRAALGADSVSVPRGDSVVAASRADLPGIGAHGVLDSAAVQVTARRDGAIIWVPRRTPALPVTELLLRALAVARDAGELFIPNDSFASDSLTFTLGYNAASVQPDGRVVLDGFHPPTLQAFSLRLPVGHEPAVAGGFHLLYPEALRQSFAEGLVRMQFVIDTTGRAVPSTVQDVWPKETPRLTGDRATFYAEFVRAARDAIVRARFTPAEIGGCRVSQQVTQALSWHLNP